jgi:ligand-binding sensor domain-containing protein
LRGRDHPIALVTTRLRLKYKPESTRRGPHAGVRLVTRRATLSGVIVVLALCGGGGAHAGARPVDTAASSPRGGVVSLPVVDQQDIRFLRFSVDADAPRSRITGITQDNYGFLWLGTTSGLYRYDGYSLKHYVHDPGDDASLSSDRIWTVYKDRAGTLWIGTLGGLDRLDAARDTFTHYRHDPTDDGSLSASDVRVVHRDQEGTLWVGTARGLDRMVPSTKGFIHYRNDPRDDATLSSNSVISLHEDRRGNLWVGTDAGLNKLEKATGRCPASGTTRRIPTASVMTL